MYYTNDFIKFNQRQREELFAFHETQKLHDGYTNILQYENLLFNALIIWDVVAGIYSIFKKIYEEKYVNSNLYVVFSLGNFIGVTLV